MRPAAENSRLLVFLKHFFDQFGAKTVMTDGTIFGGQMNIHPRLLKIVDAGEAVFGACPVKQCFSFWKFFLVRFLTKHEKRRLTDPACDHNRVVKIGIQRIRYRSICYRKALTERRPEFEFRTGLDTGKPLCHFPDDDVEDFQRFHAVRPIHRQGPAQQRVGRMGQSQHDELSGANRRQHLVRLQSQSPRIFRNAHIFRDNALAVVDVMLVVHVDTVYVAIQILRSQTAARRGIFEVPNLASRHRRLGNQFLKFFRVRQFLDARRSDRSIAVNRQIFHTGQLQQ